MLNMFVYFFAKNYIQPAKADVELCGEAGRVNRANLGLDYYDCGDELPDIKEVTTNTVTYIDGLPVLFDKNKNPIQFEVDGYPIGGVDYTNASDPQAFTEEGKPVVIISASELYVVEGGGILEGGLPAVLSDTVAVGDSNCTNPVMPTMQYPSKLADAINKYIDDYPVDNSPFSGFGSDFVQAGRNYQVNPLLLVAHATIETRLGTSGSGIEDGSNNAFGRHAGEGQPNVRAFYKYDSFQESLYIQANYMKQVYINQGLVTLEPYLQKYAESWREYIPKATRIMNKIAQDAEMECE